MNQEQKIREVISKLVYEELCARGKAYRKARMAAGEKSSAYLSGRAVKVCKGQIKGAGGKRRKSHKNEGDDAAMKKSALGMAMYGKDDYMARVEAHKLVDELKKKYDNQAAVLDIVEQPFGTLGNRKLKDISKPMGRDEKEEDLPFE